MQTWGALPLCPVGNTYYNVATGCSGGAQPTMTTFNGQDVTFSAVAQGAYVSSNDTMNGETVEVQELLGNNTLTASYDRSEQGSSALEDEPSVGLVSNAPAPGSNQTFTTLSLRDNIMIGPKVMLDFGDYGINYKSHYSPDGGHDVGRFLAHLQRAARGAELASELTIRLCASQPVDRLRRHTWV